VSKDNFDKSR